MIRVVNKRSYASCLGDEHVYIGRPSVLGNPFRIGRDGSRNDVVQKYEDMLMRAMHLSDGPVYYELLRLAQLADDLERDDRDLILICYCAPLACHGDVIKDVVNELRTMD